MFTAKTRSTLIALVASFSVAGASLAPAVAQALPPYKAPRPGMKGCTLKIGSNYSVAVDDEQYVEVTARSGKVVTLQCKNGVWYAVREATSTPVIGPSLSSPQLLAIAPEVVSSSPAGYTTAPLLASTGT